jgi:hypothetical protein
MAVSILIAKRIWKIKNVVSVSGRASAMQVVILIAWCELFLALLGIIAFVVSKN